MSAESFSDAELAFLRHARFGELPPPVRPEDRVELEETDPKRGWPDPGPSPNQQALGVGGA